MGGSFHPSPLKNIATGIDYSRYQWIQFSKCIWNAQGCMSGEQIYIRSNIFSWRTHKVYQEGNTHEKLISSVQFSHSVGPTLCNPMNRSTPGLPVHHQFPEFTQTHVHRVGDGSSHLILCRPLLLLPPIPPSIRVFSNESTLRMRWPKYWS